LRDPEPEDSARLKARDVKAWGEARSPRYCGALEFIALWRHESTDVPAFQALGIILNSILGLCSSDSLQPRLSHPGLSALNPRRTPENGIEMTGMRTDDGSEN